MWWIWLKIALWYAMAGRCLQFIRTYNLSIQVISSMFFSSFSREARNRQVFEHTSVLCYFRGKRLCSNSACGGQPVKMQATGTTKKQLNHTLFADICWHISTFLTQLTSDTKQAAPMLLQERTLGFQTCWATRRIVYWKILQSPTFPSTVI